MAYHHGDLRRAMIRAARRRLRESPDAQLSIRELARSVGVSPNAPYRHFADRDALLRAVAAEGYREASRRLARESGSAVVAKIWGELAAEEPALVAVMTTLPSGAPGDAELQEALAGWIGEVARAIEGEVKGTDPGLVVERAVACWAVVHGLTGLQRSGALGMIDDWLLPEGAVLARRVVVR